MAEAEAWDPASGARTPLTVGWTGTGTSRIEVPLGGAPLVLLVLREAGAYEMAPPAVPAPTSGGVRESAVLHGGWSGELVPTMDNTWGDMAVPAGAPVGDLQVWTMRWAQGDAAPDPVSDAWAAARVTFGQRVATIGPLPQGDAPGPLTPQQAAAAALGRQPLAQGWGSRTFSASRGTEKETGRLGMKGRVLEDFVPLPAPARGEVAVVRTLLRAAHRGLADLIVAASAAKRVWWNGVELATGDGHAVVARVEVGADAGGVDVLEYQLGESEDAEVRPDGATSLGSSFHLVPPGGEGPRPQFMTVGPGVVPDGRVEAWRGFTVPAEFAGARLVVGAATGVSVLLDGRSLARQEKVEYYEGSWGATPMYFQHDLGEVLTRGDHELRVVADSSDARDVVLVDLVVHHGGGLTTVVSGPGWAVRSGSTSGTTAEHRRRWGELAPSHAATRTHPLAAARWLNGDPAVGAAALPVSAAVDVVPAAQWYRFPVPSGTTRVTLPVAVPVTVWLDGIEVALTDGALETDELLSRVAEVLVRSEPVAFDRGGALWEGPAVVSTVAAPIELGPWPGIGLRSWSGGVRYRRTVELPVGARDVVLHLGDLRGSVEVAVDGATVGTRFCAPFTVPLGDVGGSVEVEITVLGTLGPFFEESTPTTWVFPSQRISGLFGPVSVAWTPSAAPHPGSDGSTNGCSR